MSNFVTNPGAGGSTFASDTIGGVEFPRVKIAHGAGGINDGDASGTFPLPVRLVPTIAPEGAVCFVSLDLDEIEEAVKASPGAVYGVIFTNSATATRYLKFYNLTVANTTVGSSVPVMTIGLPGNATDDVTGSIQFSHPVVFDAAITVAATTGAAVADTGAPGAGEVIVNVIYK